MNTMSPSEGHQEDIRTAAVAARKAQRVLGTLPEEAKNAALKGIAETLLNQKGEILAANAEDVAEARDDVDAGKMSPSLLERLLLDSAKIESMANGVRAVAALPDPSNRILERTLLDDGLELHKVTCPLGLLAVIFESRPDAVTQISALALKSGNAVILKGGKEAARTAAEIVKTIQAALHAQGAIPVQAVTSIGSRAEVEALLKMEDLIDLVIPRGSNSLVRHIQNSTRIPVLGHAEGVCHVYIDASAALEMALAIAADSKLQYPAACNAAETILIHHAAAPDILRPLLGILLEKGVEIKACAETRNLAPGFALKEAAEEDWRTEYCGPAVSLKIVESLDEAIQHINAYGSHHTDTIVSQDPEAARRFLDEVDAAGVYLNASTRFADGYRYGFGAEVGISTSKLHARGPVGLEGLVTYKYKLYGSGHCVSTYSGKNARPFKHEKLGVPG